MKVLELFAGTRSISKAFEARGHQTFSVEWDMILDRFGRPDVIWASPDCTTYSIAAISHHRRREPSGNLAPVSDYAKFCDRVNLHVHNLIMALSPKVWFIENPRGGHEKDGFYERAAEIHGDLLPVRRYAHEADRYMDESPGPQVQAAMPQR